MPNEKDKTKIPLCRSDFLQDVTISLGRRSLKSIRKSNQLTFEVSEECIEGKSLERLDVEAESWSEGLTRIVLWEDAVSYMYSHEVKHPTPDRPAIEIQANLAGMSPEDVAALIRATLTDPVQAKGEWHRWISRQVRSSE